MADLSTSYLGIPLPHPFAVGASPLSRTTDDVRRLEDAGAAAVTLASLYEEQLRAESMATFHSMLDPAESFGEATSYLPEPDEFVVGPDGYVEHLAACVEAVRIPIIGSLNGAEPGPWLEYATAMESVGAAAIELNIYDVVTSASESASAVEDRSMAIVRELRSRTSLPIAVKLSPFYTALPHFAGRLVKTGATGLVLFNRFFEPDIDLETLEHEPHLALSTPAELLLRLRWLSVLSGRVGCSLAVSGGVHDASGAAKAIMSGASAVQLVSAMLTRGPSRVTELAAELDRWMDEREYQSVSSMCASMNIERCPDPGRLTRAQYVRSLQTWRPV